MKRFKYTTREYYHSTHNVLSFLPLELSVLCLKMAGNPEIKLSYELKTQTVKYHTPIECKSVTHIGKVIRDYRDIIHSHAICLDPIFHQTQINRLKNMEKFLKKQIPKKLKFFVSRYIPLMEYKTTESVESHEHECRRLIRQITPCNPHYLLKLQCGHTNCPMKHQVKNTCDILIRLNQVESKSYSWGIHAIVLFE
jgi:hypothetical protein